MATKKNTKKASKKASKNSVQWDHEKNENTKGDLFLVGNTPPAIVMFPALFKGVLSYNGRQKEKKGEPLSHNDYQWQATLLFDRKDKMYCAMRDEVLASGREHHGLEGKKAEAMPHPFKDGDDQFEKNEETYEAYEGMDFLNLNLPMKAGPLLVLDEDGNEPIDTSRFYAGSICRANVSFKTYVAAGKKGVTVYWSGIQRMGDGEKVAFDRSKVVKKSMGAAPKLKTDKAGNYIY